MKIYTKTGDDGTTSLIGGTRVSKTDARIECFGTIDELSAYLGLIRDVCDAEKIQHQLLIIQQKLCTICSIVASDPQVVCENFPFAETDILFLETAIDDFQAELPPLTHIILSGGHPIASYCHIARTVCRRAERQFLKIGIQSQYTKLLTAYLNRLSDYLFVLARKFVKDFNKKEIIWNTSL